MSTWCFEGARGWGLTSCLEVLVDNFILFLQPHLAHEPSVCMLLSENFPNVVHQCVGEGVEVTMV